MRYSIADFETFTSFIGKVCEFLETEANSF